MCASAIQIWVQSVLRVIAARIYSHKASQENSMEIDSVIEMVNKSLGRRRFLQVSGAAGLGLAATTLIGASAVPLLAQGLAPKSGGTGVQDPITKDTPAEIFTAALIAEDLATTFYYNGLVGPVIQDPNLAGPGGTATHVTADGNLGNVDYLRAALSEEIAHANLFRALLGISGPAKTRYRLSIFLPECSTRWGRSLLRSRHWRTPSSALI